MDKELFNKMIEVLDGNSYRIVLRKKLKSRGLINFEKENIYIASDSRKRLDIMIHELVHAIYDDLNEFEVDAIEEKCVKTLNKKQKQKLEGYLYAYGILKTG